MIFIPKYNKNQIVKLKKHICNECKCYFYGEIVSIKRTLFGFKYFLNVGCEWGYAKIYGCNLYICKENDITIINNN